MKHGSPLWLLVLLVLAMARAATPTTPAVATTPSQQLERELRALKPDLILRTRFDDRNYVVIEHRWLTETFLPYFRGFLLHVHAAGLKGEGYDCDNFALLFRAKLVLSNLLGGGARQAEVPCGQLTVAQRTAFGGVPRAPDARHALIVVRTDQGWFVVEPQTGTITNLRSYPNLVGFSEVTF